MASLGYRRGPNRGPQFQRGSVTVAPSSLTTGTKTTVSVAIAGVKTTDIVILEPPVGLEAGLVFQGVRATNTDIDISNPTAGTIAGASRSWGYKVFKSA
jgi:hypothetical protein